MAEATTPLSVDEAVNLLNPPLEPASETAAVEGQESDLPTETEVEAADESDETGEGDETEEQPVIEVPDAPRWWDAEKKAVWATLTPDQRAAVADQEAKRELVVEKAKTEARTEREQYAGVLNALSNAVPQWIETFKSRWDGAEAPDYWPNLARNFPAEQVQEWRFAYEADQKALGGALHAQQQAQNMAEQSFYRERAERLPLVAPELADPAKGEKNLTDLSQYLVKEGFSVDTIRGASAEMMRTAWKAFKYDQLGQISAKPKNPAAPRPSVAPSAPPTRTSQVRSIEQLAAKLNKTGDVDDAVRLMQERRNQKR